MSKSNGAPKEDVNAAPSAPPDEMLRDAYGLSADIERGVLALASAVNAAGKDELLKLGYHAGLVVGQLVQSEKNNKALQAQIVELHSALLSLTRASLAKEMLSLAEGTAST